ncbi:glutathione S-transferase, amine-terminal domain protein (macronuclear) [Tetrahymena thermophila SB210]|uniref:glutathione transferase n=1 Tax=Tetrahymena thermophila (strain SB210) TaxID=312017 RepID=I7LWD6_TETTS|nr:glutathione S-transferase, amine-terminal domain protein [Tetrahymena thermophila SB210]EAS01432.1 glutathione S-transferase, amine-terminal domain protein [Tetrahymena thermophila SB210]|eukprot:XP_001021678.1 glutathione S-transferase, amine-terminal domain protein [Tetrahymena thermophila SB210]
MILGYWEIPGKCQAIRFLLEILKVEYTEKRYTFKNSREWFEEDKLKIGLDFPNLPYFIDGNIKLSESNSIVTYILDKYSKQEWKGKNEDIYKVDELRFLFTDLQSLGYLSSKGDQDAFKNYLKKLDFVYQFIKGESKFLLGYFTIADLYSWECITRLKVQWPEYYQKYSDKFDQLIQNIENIPELYSYIQSDRCLKIQPLKK